ncbi:unnamed protein product [Spodoptera exigua]|nr:unnamed protein product [Spodoptera exigua]
MLLHCYLNSLILFIFCLQIKYYTYFISVYPYHHMHRTFPYLAMLLYLDYVKIRSALRELPLWCVTVMTDTTGTFRKF